MKQFFIRLSSYNDFRTMYQHYESCHIEKRATNKSGPVNLLALGEYLPSNFIPVTDRLSRLILSEKLKNKSAAETVRSLKGFIYNPKIAPSHQRKVQEDRVI